MIQPRSRVEPLLRAWGHYYGERRPAEWGEENPDSLGPHPIARAMEFAGGDATPAIRSARGMKRLRGGTPVWGFDPLVCAETRSYRISTPEDVPPQVARVQACALELYRIDTLRGTVLRFEYCKRGTKAEKAAMLVTVGLPTGLRLYRESLAYARGWMESRLFDYR